MATNIRTHLTFDGTAEAAMNFYVDLFPRSEVIKVFHYDNTFAKMIDEIG